jgi:hypothetical protein
MTSFFPRLVAPGTPGARPRTGIPRFGSLTVLRTVDQYEEMVLAPRAASPPKKGVWGGWPTVAVSLAGVLLLVLCLVGLL